MNEHLSECSWAPPVDNYCICNLLRTCEQRVRGEEQQRIEAALTSVGQHDAAWELAVRDKALREAREAVLSAVATKTTVVMQSRYEDGMDLDDEYDTGWRDGMKCALGVSLTNIDALRSKGEEKR